MPQHTYPFVAFTDPKGNVVRHPSTYLPVRITNPHSGLSSVTYALVDTGADTCVFPEALAVSLGHNFTGEGVKTQKTQGVSGATSVFMHTFDLDILTTDRSKVFAAFPNLLIACVPQEIPALLGVADCLGHFVLGVDYPRTEITLSY